VTGVVRLVRDGRGVSSIEFAILLPVLVLFIYGTFMVGQLFYANAGMQHALGEGARYTTLCLNPTIAGGCSAPSDAQIEARMNERVFGSGMGTFTVNAPVQGIGYKDLSVTYTMPADFIFFSLPDVTMTQSKRVYTA
jgi:hypothetical protein